MHKTNKKTKIHREINVSRNQGGVKICSKEAKEELMQKMKGYANNARVKTIAHASMILIGDM
jgi:hypothetical protein